jgi:8-oxo-dGTP diphosphatase
VSHWEPPVANITVDLVVLTVRHDALHVLVVERGVEPYLGQLALPGGFVQTDEDVPMAAARELEEETHIPADLLHLEQLRTYAAPGRDPRGRVITVAYLAIAPNLPLPKGDTDAVRAEWVPVASLTGPGRHLAFDHDDILRDAVERARSKLEYSTLATAFCTETFTIGDLRRVYEVVWDVPLDPRNFQRKVLSTAGFVVATEQMRRQEAGRPARLYTRGKATVLRPSILRTH